jgi:hypothetical protein
MILLFLMQAAATPPDIVLDLRATARSVRIERRGETSLSVRAEPDGGSRTEVERPDSAGRERLRDVDVSVRAEARIADPQESRGGEETREPQ